MGVVMATAETYLLSYEELDRIRGAAHGGAMLGGDKAYDACLRIEALVSQILAGKRPPSPHHICDGK